MRTITVSTWRYGLFAVGVSVLCHIAVFVLAGVHWERYTKPYYQPPVMQVALRVSPHKPPAQVARTTLATQQQPQSAAEQSPSRNSVHAHSSVTKPSAGRIAELKPPPQDAVDAQPLGSDNSEFQIDTSRVRQLLDDVGKILPQVLTQRPAKSLTDSSDAVDDEITRHVQRLAAELQHYWKRPPNARPDMEVLLSVQLAPTGEIQSSSILRGSGYAEFDRSALSALRRVGRFEHVADIPAPMFKRHFRQLRLKFRPDDLAHP